MEFTRSDLLFDNGTYYTWNTDHARLLPPHLLDRHNGPEVLSFINQWIELHTVGKVYRRSFQLLEVAIRYDLPPGFESKKIIAEWLKQHVDLMMDDSRFESRYSKYSIGSYW